MLAHQILDRADLLPRVLPFSAASPTPTPPVPKNKLALAIHAVARIRRLDSAKSAMLTSFVGIILEKLAKKRTGSGSAFQGPVLEL
jgi:hypothetical protein